MNIVKASAFIVLLLATTMHGKAQWTLQNRPASPLVTEPYSVMPADPSTYAEEKMDFPITKGKYAPHWDSIKKTYTGTPAWFRDAKFGVFIHWGPQASGKSGDWYARNMYKEGSKAYKNHLKNFGHPSSFGYKDVLNAWKAPKWNAASLTQAFYDAGARFVMAVGVHHDNFDMWNSAYQPWNAVNVGPKKDMIGAWKAEAKKRGMKFGITFHHEYTWWWWHNAFGADKQGELAGVPYDGHLTKADGKGKWWNGLDPQLLYPVDMRQYKDIDVIAFGNKGIFQHHQDYAKWYAEWWARRIMDAVDKYDPDLIYTDGNGKWPFSGTHSASGFKCDAAARVVADFYNKADKRHGKTDVLACIKFAPNNPALGITYEINFPNKILTDKPWIGENPIGDWYYAPGYTYQASSMVYSLLEYASRDGNYACAVPITPEGDLEPECVQMLQDMGQWMKTNGEGIYGSKAWKIWGEGEKISDPKKPEKALSLRVFPGGNLSKSHAAFTFLNTDFRFTEGKNGEVYAWCMTIPNAGSTICIKSFGKEANLVNQSIQSVRLLGSAKPLQWEQTTEGLLITFPEAANCHYAAGFKVVFKK